MLAQNYNKFKLEWNGFYDIYVQNSFNRTNLNHLKSLEYDFVKVYQRCINEIDTLLNAKYGLKYDFKHLKVVAITLKVTFIPLILLCCCCCTFVTQESFPLNSAFQSSNKTF